MKESSAPKRVQGERLPRCYTVQIGPRIVRFFRGNIEISVMINTMGLDTWIEALPLVTGSVRRVSDDVQAYSEQLFVTSRGIGIRYQARTSVINALVVWTRSDSYVTQSVKMILRLINPCVTPEVV